MPDRVEFNLSRVPVFVDPVRRRPGIRKQNPFRIIVLALDRALGDFAAVLCFAMSVKAQFDHAKLLVYFRDDRPYKKPILDVCADIDEVIEMTGSDSLPLDILDAAAHAPFPPPETWRHHETAWNRSHLVILPHMARYQNLGQFDPAARFRFTARDAEVAAKRLRESGVDPDRWFCVMHYREPSYQNRRPQPMRDVETTDYEALMNWIIDHLGGQVVRIGHAEMRPFTERPGYVDLAPLGDADFMLHLFAISRARFVLASNSGPGICGSCFGTPTAMCNNPATFGVWNSQDAVMMSHIIAPDGRRVSHGVAHKREMHFVAAVQHLNDLGYRTVLQSLDELRRLAAVMHERTSDTPGWRTHWYETEGLDRPNRFEASTDPIMRATLVEFEDLAPGDGTIVLA